MWAVIYLREQQASQRREDGYPTGWGFAGRCESLCFQGWVSLPSDASRCSRSQAVCRCPLRSLRVTHRLWKNSRPPSLLFFSPSHGRRRGTRCRHGRAGSIPLRELVFSRAASLNCCCLQRAPIPLPSRRWFLFIAVALVLPTGVGSRISALLIPLVPSCLCKVFLPSVPHGAGLWEALKGQASLCLRSKHRRCRSPALCQGCRKRSRPPAFFLLFSSPAARSRQELWDLKPFCLAVGVGSHPLLPGNSTSFACLLTEAVSAVSVHA